MPDKLRQHIEAATLPVISVVGPTACGKTRRAVSLAKAFNAEIISGDSRQVYRGMDLGTGKDLDEYGDVPVHLIDICPPGYKYNLHEYLRDFTLAKKRIESAGHNIVLCGGTGMYVEAALSGIVLPEVPQNKLLRQQLADKTLEELTEILASKKQLHNTTDVDTCQRAVRAIEIEEYYNQNPQIALNAQRQHAVPLDSVIILIDIPREERRRRITERLDNRLLQGMEEEVRTLLSQGVSAQDLMYYGLEYKFVTLAVTGAISRDEMRHDLEIAIHQFAKRQMTWYRGMERRGFTLHKLPWDITENEFIQRVGDIISARI